MKTSNLDEIATSAYYLWEAAGRPNGCALEHWLRAEEQLQAARAEGEARKTATESGPNAKNSDKDLRYGLVLRSALGRSAL